MKARIEQVLREFLAGPKSAAAPPIPVFRGRGMQLGVDLMNNVALEVLKNTEPRRQRPGGRVSRGYRASRALPTWLAVSRRKWAGSSELVLSGVLRVLTHPPGYSTHPGLRSVNLLDN